MHKYMATRNMLIIKDEYGEIIGAQIEHPNDNQMMAFISPAKPEHTLHKVSDVPSEICDLADPVHFHRAITDHLKLEHAKATQTSAEELNSAFFRILASRGK